VFRLLGRFAAGLLIAPIAALMIAPAAAVSKARPKASKTVKASKPVKASAAVRRWMKPMTLRDQVAQLVFISFHGASYNSRSRDYRKFVRLIRETKVGGLILVNWSNGRVIQKAEPYALAAFINRMQRLAQTPLMVSGDFERGASMRVDGTTVFPHAMAFGATGDPSLARFEGEVTAREARALGVQWIFYPVADVNNNPDNPIINIRSFGEDPQAVAAQVRAFIEGAHSEKRLPVLTTVKHFPGHGDTAVDTHVNLATVSADREHLDRIELVPFRAAIAAGVDSVMTAHLAVPALSPADLPATLSPAILTTLLRKELDFRGLIVTDALEMGGVVKGFGVGEAAVRAIEAGADLLLMPPDPEAAIKAVLAAVRSGRLKPERIEESVVRILAAKEKVGLDRRRFVDLEAIGDVVDSPEANQRAAEIAAKAVTLVRNQGGMVPLSSPERACWVVLPESRFSTAGQLFTQEVRARAKSASVVSLDPSMTAEAINQALAKMIGCEKFVVAAFAAVSAYRNNVALSGELPRVIETLTGSGKPVALVAMGSPYLLRNFPNVTAYLATYSTVPPSETAAVRALFGEAAITGRLPVSIPGHAKVGEGIRLEARRLAAQ
jgi:beta-N-acetylhexosaminidase